MFVFLANAATQVNKVSGNNWSSMINMLGQFFFLVIVFIFILFLAYYSTKFIAKAKSSGFRGGNIKIVEGFSFGVNASIQLIKVGERYFLISVTKEQINLIAEIEKDTLNIDGAEYADIKFENIIKECINKVKKDKNS